MRILVMRDAASAARTAEALLQLGHEPIVEPLTRIVPLPHAPFPEGADGVVFTSPAAVHCLGPVGTSMSLLPVFAVGERTAAAARSAGFGDVRSADGDAGDLAPLIRGTLPQGARLLYPAGTVTARDIEGEFAAYGYGVVKRVTYRVDAVSAASERLRLLLGSGAIDAVLHFSRRAAETYLDLAAQAGLRSEALSPLHLCLSERIAAPLRIAKARTLVSEKPNESTLLALLEGGVALLARPMSSD